MPACPGATFRSAASSAYPPRYGAVSKQAWTAGPADAGARLDKFLAAGERLGSRSKATIAIDRGKVFVNDREAATVDAALTLAEGDVVRRVDGPARQRPRRARAAAP